MVNSELTKAKIYAPFRICWQQTSLSKQVSWQHLRKERSWTVKTQHRLARKEPNTQKESHQKLLNWKHEPCGDSQSCSAIWKVDISSHSTFDENVLHRCSCIHLGFLTKKVHKNVLWRTIESTLNGKWITERQFFFSSYVTNDYIKWCKIPPLVIRGSKSTYLIASQINLNVDNILCFIKQQQ